MRPVHSAPRFVSPLTGRPLALLALLVLTLLAQMLRAEPARVLSGTLEYRERVALPDDAEMRIELRAGSDSIAPAAGGALPGAVSGEMRQPLKGAQVPLAFAIPAPDTALTLHAVLYHDGRPIWTSPVVAVPAGQAALDLGPLRLTRQPANGLARWLICGTEMVQISVARNRAVLRLGAQSRQLRPLIGSPGIVFADTETPRSSVRPRGEAADVTWSGRRLPLCLPFADPAREPLTARGNEPGWALSLGPDGVAFSAEDGSSFTLAPLPDPTPIDGGLRYTGPVTAHDTPPTTPPTVDLLPGLCRDTMSGMPYPFALRVTASGETLTGCGGNPLTLLQGDWLMVEHEATALTPPLALRFDADRMAGDTGCNRFMAPLTLTGETLTLGPVALTRRACAPDAMQREAALTASMAQITGFEIEADGSLALLAGGRPLIRARR